MKVIAIGNTAQIEEIKNKFGATHEVIGAANGNNQTFNTANVIFDFNNNSDVSVYKGLSIPVFINTVFTTLQSVLQNNPGLDTLNTFGFCGLSTFFNRGVLEVCNQNHQSEQNLKSVCAQLETDYVIVKDQVGFVTPRVIGMIINEAYLTAEEGTASVTDIDLAMKLGTNYPYGPFEWAKRIGINEVIKLMDAVYKATRDERYQICHSLRNAGQH